MKSTRKSSNVDAEVLRIENTKVVRSWSSINRIIHGIDALAARIKSDTGVQCDRSKLMNALAELAMEHGDKVDTSNITDHDTLKDALLSAIRKKR